MKYILSVMIVLFLGCSQKSYVFVDEPKSDMSCKKDISLGVKEISLPYYLEDAKVPYIKDSRVEFFKNSDFTDDTTSFATKRAMWILRDCLSERVYEYPFSEHSIEYILEVDIQKLITIKDSVVLDGSWRVYDKNKRLIKSSNYHDSIQIKNFSAKDSIDGMSELFDRFIKNIARNISGL